MTTVAGLAEAVASVTRRPKSEVCTHIRALRERDLLPTASSRYSVPHVTDEQAILALIAVTRNAPLKISADMAEAYFHLGVKNDDYDDAPFTFGQLLVAEMNALTSGDDTEFAGAIIVESPILSARVIYDRDHSVEAVALAEPNGGLRFGPHAGHLQRQTLLYRDSLEQFGRALDS